MDSTSWDGFVSRHSESKIYHLSGWGSLLKQVHGHRLFYLEDDDGVFPLALVKSFIFGDRLISLPFGDYGGPCAESEASAERLISRSEEVAREQAVDFLEIRSPHQRYHPLLERHGFRSRDDYFTFRLPLNTEAEVLWKKIGDKNRNMVRKAERHGIHIVEASSENDLMIFYHIYTRTMKRLGSPPQPYRFFQHMWHLLYPAHLKLPMAWQDDKCVASAVFFLYRDIVHYSYSCSLKRYAGIGSGEAIQWYIISWGRRNNYRELDFGRTRENSRVWLFKRKWGGELIKMTYFYKFYKKQLAQRQEAKYQRLSELWRKYLPLWLANRLGPWVVGQIG